MNSFYRVVFCKSTGVFKAVSETAKSGKKTKSISIAAGVLSAGVVFSTAALAATGDPVVAGDAAGLNALAVGETNTVDGNRSTAIGSENSVGGESNTALGVNNNIRPTEDYFYNGDSMETLLTPSIRSTAIGVENTIEGNESVTTGVFNKAYANNVTITGGRNEVSSNESGTYGQGNYVGRDMIIPALMRVDDGYRIGYRGYIDEGSYAYGNSNQVIGDKSHAVGNSNNVSGNKNGLLGSGNRLSTERYEQPRRMATARIAADDGELSRELIPVGDGELSRELIPVGDGELSRTRWDGRDEGSFLVGNENEVNGINTHAVGNQNQIRNDDNVTLGSGNRVEFYQDEYMGEAARIRDDSERRIIRRNTSTAIVGANNKLEAAGVHIVGTENNIQQAYSYVVGGGNTIQPSFNSPMNIAGAPEMGSNVFGSRNYTESGKSSVLGDGNRIDQNSLLAVVTGGENNISGASSSTVGNANQIRKDVGGAHGTMNRVRGNAGALRVITDTLEAYNSGEVEVFEGLDLDNDGVVDFATVEEFMSMVMQSGSYAYGNINNIQGEGIHTVGNNNEFSGNNNKGVGNNNRIGQVGGMVDNSDAVLPTVEFYDSAVYGDLNIVNANSAQAIGNKNRLEKDFSSITGYNNTVTQGLDGELVDVTIEQQRLAGTFVSGNDNLIESHGGHVSGSGNDFQADRATLSGSENTVIGNEGHVVGNDNNVYGSSNNGLGNNNVIGKVMNGDYSSVDSSHVVGNNNTIEGDLSSAFGNENTATADNIAVLGSSNTVEAENSFVVGSNSVVDYGADGSLVFGSKASSSVQNGIAIGNGSTVGRENTVSFGSAGEERQLTNVADATETKDAVNLGQLNASLRDTTGGKNLTATRTDTGYEVALNDAITLDSVTTGSSTLDTNGLKVGDVTVSSVGLDNAGNRVTSVGNAIERSDAVNYGQFTDGLAGTIKSVTGDENVVAVTDANKNVTLALQKDVVVDSVTTGATSFNTDGVRAGDVFLSSTTGLDNAGNRVTSVGNAIERSDAVNYGQFTDGLAGTIKSVTGDENVVAVTDANKNVALALQKDVVVDSVTTGATSFNTDGVRAGDVFLSSTSGLDNAGNRITSVGDAVENTDAVNFGQFKAGLTDTTAGKNIAVKRTDTGYEVSVLDDIALNSMTAGTTVVNTDGLKAGSVTVSSTGVDNAGNRVTSVGDAIEQTDAVNLKQLNASLRDTTGDENITATKTDTGYNVALNKNVALDSVTTGTTSMGTDGVRAGDVLLSSTTGLDNAGNRVTSVGDAIERSDAVNYGQFTDGLAGTIKSVTGDENVVAVTDANKNVTLALQKDVVVDSVTTGATSFNTDGVRAGDIFLSSTTGLDNAGNRVTSVGDAIERSDAVNYGQFQDGLNGIVKTTVAGDKNITSTKSDTGYDLTLNDDLIAVSMTTGDTLVNTDGLKVGDVTVGATGLDNAGNRVTSVGDAIIRSDAVNYGQFTDGLAGTIKSVTGDENITATTDAEKNVVVSLNKNAILDSVTAGNSYFNTDGFRAGEVFLSSTSGLSNAGYRITKVGDAVAQDDAVNLKQLGSVDDRLTQVNNQQNTSINNNTAAINQGFNVGNGTTSNKFDLGDTVNITAGTNTVVNTTPTGVQVDIAKDIVVDSVTTGSTSVSNAGVNVGGVSITETGGLNNSGFTVSGVGDAVNRDEAINKGQFDDALRDLEVTGVATTVTGDSNIIATTTGIDVSLELAKDINVDSVTAGNSSMSNDGFKTGDVSITANSGLNNAGFTVQGVGDGVKRDDAVNKGQLDDLEVRQNAKNDAQDIIINNKADTSYVDAADSNLQNQIDQKVDRSDFVADQARQDEVMQEERDIRDAKDKDLQAQVDKKVEREEFEADQKRQDEALKTESDARDAKDKDLQAQVDKKVEREEFEADQARQDAALKAKADKEYVNTQVSSSNVANNEKYEAMVAQQSKVDAAQDVRINNNTTMITDLGYRVDDLEDKLSAGIASSIAFAAMPSAVNNGEVRISGGTGYFNGQGALAVGLTGASETGDYTYKFGGSYSQDGGAVVGAGISYRIW